MSGIIATASTAGPLPLANQDPSAAIDHGAFQAALGDAMAARATTGLANSTAQTTEAPAPDQRPSALKGSALSKDDQVKGRTKIAKSAQDFEAMFLGQMLEPMFSGLKSEAPFGGGHAEETWRSFLVQEYGKTVAKRGGVGIAKIVESQMLDMAGLSDKTKLPPTGLGDPAGAPDSAPKAQPALTIPALPAGLSDPTKFALPGMEIKA